MTHSHPIQNLADSPDSLVDCPYCDGLGQTHCYVTLDPSERPRWRDCTYCRGIGELTNRQLLRHIQKDSSHD